MGDLRRAPVLAAALVLTAAAFAWGITGAVLAVSLAAVGRVYVGPASGVMVEALGWPTFFVFTVFRGLWRWAFRPMP